MSVPDRCNRCLRVDTESGITTHVTVQLIHNGPLHLWRRNDFASNYLGHHATLCGRTIFGRRRP